MRLEAVLRWSARVWGIASALLLLAFAFGGREHLRLTAGETLGFLLFPVGVIAGFAVSWRRELAGGLVTVGSLALFYLLLFARDGRLPAGPYFLLFAAPGFLHVASALLAAGGLGARPPVGSRGGPGNQDAEPSAAPDPARDADSRGS
jgi:hypothetical protein